MRILKLFPAALALVAVASCSNNDLIDFGGSKAVDGKTMEASIETAPASTRAAFAENKTDGKVDARELVWTVGDSYKVYGELATADKYTLQNASAGKANGTFDLMTEDYNENPAFAVFPYDKIEADRASKKLTVTLNDWTYGTAEVKDEGFNQGAFISNVPMFGKISAGDPKSAAFGYMTALLRVDLAKLPKRTTRLIVVTDRPLTGEFETEFDLEGAYPEIVSPVSNGTEKDMTTDVDKDGNPEKAYILAIATEPVAQRTNKTFFIPVPTGNKYKKFDIYVEYNMAGSTETELVGKLGNDDRPGKILNWQRGKVKSLTKEITVTSKGNTPAQIAAFLKDEWKSFPADADINITVADVDGNAAPIDMSGSSKASRTFTVPAELSNRVINIYVDETIAEGYNDTKMLHIVDADPAPVASTSKRLINFCIPTTNGPKVSIAAPESQIMFSAPDEDHTATYIIIQEATVSEGDMTQEKAGLIIGKDVTFGDIALKDGSFLSEGIIANLTNDGNYETLIKGDAGTITSKKNGAITVEGELGNNDAIVKNVGAITANGTGAVSIKNVVDVAIADGGEKQAGAVTIENVKGVSSFKLTTNAKHNAPISIKGVTTLGVADFEYNGLAAVTIDDVIGGSTIGIKCFNAKATGDLKVTNLGTAKNETAPATVTNLIYDGTGNVEVTGVINNKKVYPKVETATIYTSAADPRPASNVTFKDVTIATTLTKYSTGALTIDGVHAPFGKLTNHKGDVTITGSNAAEADITLLIQQQEGNIILKDLSNPEKGNAGKLVKLILGKKGQKSVTYENTFIGTLQNSQEDEKVITEVYGTKASGIGEVVNASTANNNYTTDVWDGVSYTKIGSDNIYTSGSFASLTKVGGATGAVKMYVDIDLNNKPFNDATTGVGNPKYGIVEGVTSLVSAKPVVLPATSNPAVIKNLNTTTGLFRNRIGSTDLALTNITVNTAKLSAPAAAGTIIGSTTGILTLKNVKVIDAEINTTKKYDADAKDFGGMVGKYKTNTLSFDNCSVENVTIHGHYHMGGFLGSVEGEPTVVTALVEFKDKTKTNGVTFDVQSADNKWSREAGTVAPFIGGITGKLTNLSIDNCSYAASDLKKSDWKYNMKFLEEDESMIFIGTNRADTHFIGFTSGSIGNYYLKLESGFEANPMKAWVKDDVVDTNYNAFAK